MKVSYTVFFFFLAISLFALCWLEAPVAASPGGYDQNRAKMIGIPLPLQVAAISPVGSEWWDVQDS